MRHSREGSRDNGEYVETTHHSALPMFWPVSMKVSASIAVATEGDAFSTLAVRDRTTDRTAGRSELIPCNPTRVVTMNSH